MFLKRNRRTKNGETYEYWSLVETVRTGRGPRHRLVAKLGKLPGLDQKHRHGWENLAALLDGKPGAEHQARLDLFGDERHASAAAPDASPPHSPQWMEVDVRGLRVGRVRDFGQVYLALALWRRLGLHTLLEELLPKGRETIPWSLVACILAMARFCGNRSELEVAERWYRESALEDLLGVGWEQVYDNRLYRGLDCLIEQKDAICQHLLERYRSWFGVDFEFLLYDVTSTYFEGQAEGNAKAKRGYSRDKRPDCKQINIGLVVTPEGGLPVGYEIFDGNRADVTTVEDMVRLMEDKYGKAKRVWVMDRGMVSEENLDFLRERGASYLVGTPKGQLRRFELALLEDSDWSEVRPGVEVKLVDHPDGRGGEQYIVARSKDRREKDPAKLWTWYIHLTQAEECFRISKSDLSLRPVFHQKTERVEAHVLVCFLTLAMWRTLEMWMKGKGLGNCSRQLLKEVSTIRMMDVVLPVRDAGELNLRVVSRPEDRVAQLLARLDLELPTAPKIISNVVSKIEGGEG